MATYNVTLGDVRHRVNYNQGGVFFRTMPNTALAKAATSIADMGGRFIFMPFFENGGLWRFDRANYYNGDGVTVPSNTANVGPLWNFQYDDSLEDEFNRFVNLPECPDWVLPMGVGESFDNSSVVVQWMTPEYIAAFIEYLTGTADPTPAAPSWGNVGLTRDGTTAYEFYQTSGGNLVTAVNDRGYAVGVPRSEALAYNWANLRALRGRTDPWPFRLVMLGTEPIGRENMKNPSHYVTRAGDIMDECMRRQGTPLPFRTGIWIGGENLYQHWVDTAMPGMRPFFVNADGTKKNDCAFIMSNTFFPPNRFANDPQTNILWGASVKTSGATAWWYPSVGLTGVERAFRGPEYAHRLVDHAAYPQDTKDHIVWGSWAYLMSGAFAGDMWGALSHAVGYGLAMGGTGLPTASRPAGQENAHVNYCSPWQYIATWDGKAFVSETRTQPELTTIILHPAYYMTKMFQGFSGNDMLNYSYTGGQMVPMTGQDAASQAEELQIFPTRRTDGSLELWVVNSSDVNTHTIAGLESYNVVRYEQLKSSSYTTKTGIVNTIIPRTTLTFDPISVSKVQLSQSTQPPPPPPPLPAVLSVSTTALAFGTSRTPQTFTITNTGGSPLSWTASEAASWITLSATSGSLAPTEVTTVTVTVSGASVAPGNYNANITVTGTSSPNHLIAVSMTDEDLTVSTLSLDFGQTTTERTFTVGNTGNAGLAYTVSESVSWLSCSPTSGTIPSSSNVTITVTADRSGLSDGLYSTNIEVSDGFKTFLIDTDIEKATIAQNPGILEVSVPSLDFGTDETVLTYSLTNSGGVDILWSATDDMSWLTTSPTSGNLAPLIPQVVTGTANRVGLTPNNYAGTITTISGTQTKQVAVTLVIPVATLPTDPGAISSFQQLETFFNGVPPLSAFLSTDLTTLRKYTFQTDTTITKAQAQAALAVINTFINTLEQVSSSLTAAVARSTSWVNSTP